MASFPMFMPFQMLFPAVVSNHTGNNACRVLVLPNDSASLPRPDPLCSQDSLLSERVTPVVHNLWVVTPKRPSENRDFTISNNSKTIVIK